MLLSQPFLGGILFAAYSESDFFGKLIFIALFALSILTWLILIQKTLHYKNVRKDGNKFQQLILTQRDSMLNITFQNLNAKPQEDAKNPFGKIYDSLKEKAIELLDKNHFFHKNHTSSQESSIFLTRSDVELIEAYLLSTITKEGKKLEKNLFILSTSVSLAPFLGILGTVWGILISLGELQKGGMVHSNSVLLGGLSTALATTVLGLVIAIPALIAYNYLRNCLSTFYSDMEDFSNLLLSTLELQYRRVE